MEKNLDNSKSSNNKYKFNYNLTRGILEFLPHQLKFLFLQIFKWNNVLNKILESLFLNNFSNLKVKNSLFEVSHLISNENQNIQTKTNEKDDLEKKELISKENPFTINYLCPKEIFFKNDIINFDQAKLIYELNNKLIRGDSKIDKKKLKYYAIEASSKHHNQCLTNVAKKNSNFYNTIDGNYWSSYPSVKHQSEYIILKIHPGMSMIDSIHVKFYTSLRTYKCEYITVSFGLTKDNYYFTTDKIEMNKERRIESNWIYFNTSFLANYVKIQFYEKIYQEYQVETEDNYYVVLDDLNFFGINLKNIDQRNIIYDDFAKNNILMNPQDYFEILLLLDRNKFMESNFYMDIKSNFDSIISKDKNDYKQIREDFIFFHKYQKFIKIHPEKQFIEKFIEEILNREDNLLSRLSESYLKLVAMPDFKVFRIG